MFRTMTKRVNLHNEVQRNFAKGYIPEGETFMFTRAGMKQVLGETSPTAISEPFTISSYQHGRVDVLRPMGYGGLSMQILEHVPVKFITTERAEEQRLSNLAKKAFVKGVKTAESKAADTATKVRYLPNLHNLKPDTAAQTEDASPARRSASVSQLNHG